MERLALQWAELDLGCTEAGEEDFDHPLEVEVVELGVDFGGEAPERLTQTGEHDSERIGLIGQFGAGQVNTGPFEEAHASLMFEILGRDGQQARDERRTQNLPVGL